MCVYIRNLLISIKYKLIYKIVVVVDDDVVVVTNKKIIVLRVSAIVSTRNVFKFLTAAMFVHNLIVFFFFALTEKWRKENQG